MASHSLFARSSGSLNTLDKFKKLCDAISQMTAQEGVKVVSYRNDDVPYFRALNPVQKEEVLENLQIYADILVQTLKSGHKISESKQLSWNAFKMLKLKPTSDFFNYMDDESIIEIYTSGGIQIFRNLKFFEICSYTLEDLYCRPWFELFERDESVIKKIEGQVMQLLTGAKTESYHPAIDVHFLQEKNSPFQYKLSVSIDVLSPVVDEIGQSSSYFAAIESASIINALSSQEKNEKLKRFYLNNSSSHLRIVRP